MTTLRKEPTTAEPSRTRMTGMRMAQTRGGKKFWRGWSESTKGCGQGGEYCVNELVPKILYTMGERAASFFFYIYITYHEQSPEGVVKENNRGSHEHGGAYEFVKLRCAKEIWC